MWPSLIKQNAISLGERGAGQPGRKMSLERFHVVQQPHESCFFFLLLGCMGRKSRSLCSFSLRLFLFKNETRNLNLGSRIIPRNRISRTSCPQPPWEFTNHKNKTAWPMSLTLWLPSRLLPTARKAHSIPFLQSFLAFVILSGRRQLGNQRTGGTIGELASTHPKMDIRSVIVEPLGRKKPRGTVIIVYGDSQGSFSGWISHGGYRQ